MVLVGEAAEKVSVKQGKKQLAHILFPEIKFFSISIRMQGKLK